VFLSTEKTSGREKKMTKEKDIKECFSLLGVILTWKDTTREKEISGPIFYHTRNLIGMGAKGVERRKE